MGQVGAVSYRHDVRRLPRPSEVFVSFSFGCSVPAAPAVATSVTASHCRSNGDTAALADAAIAAARAATVATFAAVPIDAAATHAAVITVVTAAA